jgi:hypothetical protein
MCWRLAVSAAQGRFTVAEASSQSQACLICSLTKKESNQAGGRWVNRPLSMRPILDHSIFHFVRSFRTNPPPMIGKVLLQGRSSKAKKRRGGPVGLAPAGHSEEGGGCLVVVFSGGWGPQAALRSIAQTGTSHRRRHTGPTDDDPNGSWSRSMAQGERRVLVECPLRRQSVMFLAIKRNGRPVVSSVPSLVRRHKVTRSPSAIRHQANTHPFSNTSTSLLHLSTTTPPTDPLITLNRTVDPIHSCPPLTSKQNPYNRQNGTKECSQEGRALRCW